MQRIQETMSGVLRHFAGRWLVGAVAALGTWPAAADAIAIDGETYRDVHIRRGEHFYYVQVPETGEIINVRRDVVPSKDVTISEDPALRARLLDQWRATRRANQPEDATTRIETPSARRLRRLREALDEPGAAQAPEPSRGTSPRRDSVPVLGNRTPPKRPQFVGKTGTVLLTNRPDRFRRQREYVEVLFDFEPIVVPPRYRPASHDNRPAAPFSPSAVKDLVTHYAGRHGLDPHLVLAVIRQESNFVARARSRAGACGLMQLMPGTAVEMGVADIFDPAQNIAGGTQYLAKMLRLFDGSVDLALAGYNAGPGNVKKFNGIPPFRETRTYVRRVKQFHQEYAAGRGTVQIVAGAPPPTDTAGDEQPPYLVEFRNGWTQPAEEIAEVEDYYFVTMGGRTTQVRKAHVRSIKDLAA